MNYQDLRKQFQVQVYPSEPNEWDIEDALYDLEDLDEEQQLMLLRAVPTIWPISHSLSFSFLKEGARNGRRFSHQSLAEWLRRILSYYEEGGLKKARAYMTESDVALLLVEEKSSSASFENSIARLTSYTRGISGLQLSLQSSTRIYTDTETIYLPENIDFFPSHNLNLLTYTLLIGLQTGFITLGSFGRHRFALSSTDVNKEKLTQLTADEYFAQFDHVQMAKDTYQLIELYRVMVFLKYEYPGLVRETADIRRKLFLLREKKVDPTVNLLERLLQAIVLPENSIDPDIKKLLTEQEKIRDCESFEQSHRNLYAIVSMHASSGVSFSFWPFMDGFDFVEAERLRDLRIAANRKKFETVLADFLINKQVSPTDDAKIQVSSEQADSAKIQLVEDDGTYTKKSANSAIIIDNESLELPDEILELIAQILADQGAMPEGYVSAAFGIAGQGRPKGVGEREVGVQLTEKFIPYDEWDYRRHGYRKNWCGLRERTLKGVRSNFIERTLATHRRVLIKIRRQFELMRTQERFVRRRRHGDDLDLDALMDSLGDQRAGLPPSEKLFIRLIRNERSISTYFLVDMSNSTEGWVGIAIKEALVILCEAMEVVGDNYAIYGFSGMRRMRSEVYKIKDIQEAYSPEVKERLAAISPKEYTRMGPPIRHMINNFKKCDTKTKLLLILSDGKPEDYDDYKGRYAIEDTRKALAEARGNLIHPYCITIDKESHDYLEYMFGRGNYAFVKDIQQLPSRLTEIYRLLTR